MFTQTAPPHKKYLATGMAQIATTIVTGSMPPILQRFDETDSALANIISELEAKMNEANETLDGFVNIICMRCRSKDHGRMANWKLWNIRWKIWCMTMGVILMTEID